MSTTPNPNPVDPTPVDPTPVDPTPVDPTPVDPAVSGAGFDSTPPEVPFEAESTSDAVGSVDSAAADEPAAAGPTETSSAAEKAKHRAAEAANAMRQADLKALYAAAGATEVLVGAVRETLTESERWARARLSELRFRRQELAKQAEEMRQRAEGLPEDVKAVPEVAKTRVADLQQQATGTYSDLANRGQRSLQDVRTEVFKRIDPAFDKIQERVDAARRALRGAAAPTPPAPMAPTAPTAPAAPSAPATETPFSAPVAPAVDDLSVEDAVLVDDVVEAPEPRQDQDRPQDR
ncbi:MAG: Endo-1,4-beta-xylanase [uncultured Friedmanniella sp.]|uniref:Endo-1,4-beta-xylanase n=1 Tax=uncultured Friedmanniella sp. TaxID=335381 RepID=A0A6J4KPL1_9ACTN|nr:hypothetical protein [uncultured Friedmanniella sp.]CAA9308560.1 MAG: Endo-1,4-beta-xylanase [uncultured Friedmanniella sp.]